MAHEDMKAARQTYDGFISKVKVGSILVALVTAFVVWLIA